MKYEEILDKVSPFLTQYGRQYVVVLFQNEDNKMLRIVALFSGGASAVRYLLDKDPRCGTEYEFIHAFTDDESASGIWSLCDHDLLCSSLDYRRWCKAKQVAQKDLYARQGYFEEVVEHISEYSPDVILLSGFMLVITQPFLSYRNILNVHPSDLRIVNSDGSRKYTGANAVSDAINAGEESTCSTIHLVTDEVDGGPIITVSEPLYICESSPKEHQDFMKDLCDGPAYVEALRLIIDAEYILPSQN